MADGITATVDATALTASLKRLGDTALKYTKPACKVSADSIEREARRRVAIGATGQTREGISVVESYDRTGYAVLTSDARSDAGQFVRDSGYKGKGRIAPAFKQEKHVGLWLEHGTRRGRPKSHTAAARPWFWPSVRLEVPQHERRISQAIDDAMKAEGF